MKSFWLNKSLNVLKACGHALGAYLVSQGITRASLLHLGAGALLVLKSFVLDYFHHRQALPSSTLPGTSVPPVIPQPKTPVEKV